MKALLLFFFLRPVAAEERTLSVRCSCDPPGVHQSAGFNCAAHCSPPGSGGAGYDMTVFNSMFNASMQNYLNAQAADAAQRQHAERMRRQMLEDARRLREDRDREFERRRQGVKARARKTFEDNKAAATAELKGPDGPGNFGLKEDETPAATAAAPKRSILEEAMRLLMLAKEANAEADRGLQQ